MPAFIEDFVIELDKRKDDLLASVSPDAHTPEEERIKEGVEHHWHHLPESKSPDRQEFAVDSSRATRTFFNGTKMTVVNSIIAHKGDPYRKLFLDFYCEDEENYPMRMSELYEAQIILDHIAGLDGSVVFVDGSFYSRLQYYLIPLGIEEKRDLPLKILETYVTLLEECERRSIMLINVSKVSNVKFLTSMILGKRSKVLDVGALHRWSDKAGFSTPLLVSGNSFMHHDFQTLLENPYVALGGFREKEKYLGVLDRLLNLSSFLMVHVRLAPGENVLRIDVPAFSCGIKRTIKEVECDEWCSSEVVSDALSYVISSYGGPNVYNALLWTADKLVRLERKTVDGIFMHIVREMGKDWIDFDRSYGRFAL